MSQLKRHSFLETCLSTVIGFVISFITNLILLPAFGLHPSMGTLTWLTIIFTVISIVRGYYVRRLFNYLHVKGIL